MRMVLEESELWDIVAGVEVRPSNSSQSFDKRDRKALATIVLNLEDSQLLHIRSCKSSAEAWSKLEEVFETKSLANRLFLRRKFFTAQMDEANSMISHINKVRSMAQQLEAIGAEVREEDIVMTLLSSLPQTYGSLIIALESRSEDLTMEFVVARLLHEETRRNENRIERSTDDTALFHDKRTNTRQIRSPNSFKGNCNYCNRPGHWARTCRKRIADEEAKKKSSRESRTKEHVFTSTLTSSSSDEDWYIDSGASQHLTYCRDLFTQYESIEPKNVYMGDNSPTKAVGKGTIRIAMQTDNGFVNGLLTEVLYVPGIAKNLFSVSKSTSEGLKIEFSTKFCFIRNNNGTVVGKGVRENNLYKLSCRTNNPERALLADTKIDNVELWHRRFGHLGVNGLKLLSKLNMVNDFDFDDNTELKLCTSCIYGKQHRTPFPNHSDTRAKELLEIVHTDVCGPMRTTSLGGARYFVTFTDDKSRQTFVYTMKHKSDTLAKFQEFKSMAENTTGKRIKILRCDNGGEYDKFNSTCVNLGIIRQTTAPYSPQQNGVAERLNRTIMESARCMLHQAGLSREFWAEAVTTAVYIKNRSPTKALTNIIPEEAWSGRKPSVRHLRIFGCDAYVHIPKERRSKLDPKSVKCIFLGYCQGSKAYRLYNTETRQIVKSRDVIFDEPVKCTKDISIEKDEINDNKHQSETQIITPTPIESVEIGRKPSNIEIVIPVRSSIKRNPSERIEETTKSIEACLAFCEEPQTLEEALQGENSKQWKEAMEEEYNSLLQNETWALTPLPTNRTAIGCKWVFRIKYNAEGNVDRFKARLVAKGFLQKEGLDYNETFAPVAKFSSIRCILAIAAIDDAEVHQMDVKTAFLNGELNEDIYMEQPEGFVKESEKNLVCKLNKALYGLKQSPRAWYSKINNFLLSIGFIRTNSDHSVFVKISDKIKIIIAIYVDDLIIACNNLEELNRLKGNFSKSFEMKDLL